MLPFLFIQKISSEPIEISDDILRYNLYENKTASVLGSAKKEKMINLTIPQNVEYEGDNYTVISIEKYSFNDSEIFGPLTLPESLQYIGYSAFRISYEHRENDKLVGVSGELLIPASIIEIESYAFHDTLITSLNILSNKITKISDWVFGSTELSGEVHLPESIEEIGVGSFSDTIINKINFPSSLKTIGNYSFCFGRSGNSERLLPIDIIIPDSVTKIGSHAFYGASITSFIFGKNISEIANNTFAYCDKLQTEIKIPNSVITINERAFFNSAITSVIFGDNLERIGKEAFLCCYNLKCTISFPKSLNYIGDSCFACSQINGTIDGSNLEIIEDSCFMRTHISSFIFPSKINKIPDYLFINSDLSGEIILPETVKEIGDFSFTFTQITKINFPISLIIIGVCAFYSCNKLTIHTSELRLVTIKSSAFYDCSLLAKTIDIEADFIGPRAFQGCSSIIMLEIRTNSPIEKMTFEYCTSLKSVIISSPDNSIEYIGKAAFAYCTSLKEVILPEEIKTIKANAFYMCSSYSGRLDLTIYPNLTTIGDEAFFGCNQLFGELSFPDSLETICNGSFTGCHITGSLVIPNNVKTIGPYAFFKCTELSGIISIGDSVTDIGDSAFALCSNVAGNIIFGQKVEIIHKRAFFGCSAITGNLILPPNIREIRDAAFYNCVSLKGELTLPNSLQYIGDNAFAECKELTGSLTIPKSVQRIGKNAFFNCKGFDDIYFKNRSTIVGHFAFSNTHIKCFSGAPESVRTNDPEIYSSDNFKGIMLPKSFLNFYCPSFYAIDGILVGITALASTGVLSAAALFAFNWFANKKTNINKYKDVFNEIIEQERHEKDINDDEIAQRIINKINERLSYESNDKDFTTTESQAIDALNKSLEESWSTICIQQKRKILENSFNDVNFKVSCSKCNTKCLKRADDDLSEEISNNIAMATLV